AGAPGRGRREKHPRRRIEPAALIEQPSEPAAVLAVLLDGVLVVNAGDEPLVADEEQRHPRRFVDAAALRFDDPVLDLIRHAEAVASADPVRLEEQLHLAAERA